MCLVQPKTYPATHDTIRRARSVMLVPTGNRRRQLLFLPGHVVKLAIGRRERDAAVREADHASTAAAHPFWSDLALAPDRVPFLGMAMRRHGGVRLEDYADINRLLGARLTRACDWSDRQPMSFFLWRAAHTGPYLSGSPRHLDGLMLPMTSMHGDLHMFNFVRTETGFGLLDWVVVDPPARSSTISSISSSPMCSATPGRTIMPFWLSCGRMRQPSP